MPMLTNTEENEREEHCHEAIEQIPDLERHQQPGLPGTPVCPLKEVSKRER